MRKNGSQKHILVEADPSTRAAMIDYFVEHRLQAHPAPCRTKMIHQIKVEEPDLIILDQRLGQTSELDLLREIRSQSKVPVIITTDYRGVVDKVVGLELGADDYIIKPISLRELLARVNAVLRRCSIRSFRQRDTEPAGYRFNGWHLEPRIRRLARPDGTPAALTNGEYALLVAFLDAPQRVLSRAYLLQATRIHEDVLESSLSVQVLRLRRKLETDRNASRVIKTERGLGYVFSLPVKRTW